MALTPAQGAGGRSGDAGTRHGLVVTFSADTGPRAGGSWALRVRSSDLLPRSVRVFETANDLGTEGLSFAPPKTETSRRTVVLLRLLADEIAAEPPR